MRSAFAERLIAAIESVTGEFPSKRRAPTIIVGTNPRMQLLAAELEAADKRVSFISLDTERLSDSEACAESVLARAGAEGAQSVLAATSSDFLNLTLCRIARDRFHIPLVITGINLLSDMTSWARITEVGMTKLTWREVVLAVFGGAPIGGSFARIAYADDDELVAEVEMFAPAFVGRTVADLPLRGSEAVALRRKDLAMPGFQLEKIRLGDVITLVGKKAKIDEVRGSMTL